MLSQESRLWNYVYKRIGDANYKNEDRQKSIESWKKKVEQKSTTLKNGYWVLKIKSNKIQFEYTKTINTRYQKLNCKHFYRLTYSPPLLSLTTTTKKLLNKKIDIEKQEAK